jgi:hypothetical protein
MILFLVNKRRVGDMSFNVPRAIPGMVHWRDPELQATELKRKENSSSYELPDVDNSDLYTGPHTTEPKWQETSIYSTAETVVQQREPYRVKPVEQESMSLLSEDERIKPLLEKHASGNQLLPWELEAVTRRFFENRDPLSDDK